MRAAIPGGQQALQAKGGGCKEGSRFKTSRFRSRKQESALR